MWYNPGYFVSLLIMKKLITAILAVVYLGTSSGATLRFHYCMGELVSWGLGSKEAALCPGCGMPKKDRDVKGCCKDEHKFIKNTNDQKNTEAAYPTVNLVTAIEPAISIEINCVPRVVVSEKKPYSNAPPRRCGTPVYILNCVFLI